MEGVGGHSLTVAAFLVGGDVHAADLMVRDTDLRARCELRSGGRLLLLGSRLGGCGDGALAGLCVPAISQKRPFKSHCEIMWGCVCSQNESDGPQKGLKTVKNNIKVVTDLGDGDPKRLNK